ncbi:MFS transporter [uncultured Nocardioides sp.]|uniref:MFS transporter n=1 Tax=uncultured Nocardioides sp. TaxID=198441 RepID=UPI00260D9DD0|nr:MFS transporter [uncultured Nocardioides sp.]
MTATSGATGATGATAATGHVLGDAALRRVVAVLCVGQITSWGVLYYALPVLAPAISADTGWSPASVVAAFSTGLVVNALAGIATGRGLDRWGPRRVMTTGSVVGVAAVVGLALAPSYPVFLLAWVVAGAAMSATLYAPSFAAVTGWAGDDPARRVRALTAVTLVGGLASTAFAPLTAALVGPLGWRGSYLALAVVLALVTVPAHLLGLRGRWDPPRRLHDARGGPVRGPTREPAFWLMGASFTLAALAVYAGVVNLVPLLVEHGVGLTTAAVVLGIGGAGQVLGRLVWAPVVARTALRTRTAGVFVLVGLTSLVLALVPGPLWLVVLVSLLAGSARGVVTLLHATGVTDRWGAADFGRLNGLLTAPLMLASALSPWAGAAVAQALGSYAAAFAVIAVAALLAALLAPFTLPRRPAR